MYLTTVPPEKAMIRKIIDIFKEENMIALIKVHLDTSKFLLAFLEAY